MSPGTLTALHAPELTAWAIRGDRQVRSSLSVRSAPPVCGGCVGLCRGSWMEHAHADQPSVVIDALDRVSVQLELADDGGRKVNPARVTQLAKSDRLVARRRSRSGSRCCWASASVIDRIVALHRDCRRVGRLVAGVEALAGGRVHPPASGAHDVGVNPVTHAGAPPKPGRHQPVQKTRVLTITSDRSRENSRSRGRARAPPGDQHARFTRRRAAPANDLSPTGAPTGLWRSGVCSGPRLRLRHSRLTRSAILATSVAASLRWTPRPGLRLSRVALLASGQSPDL